MGARTKYTFLEAVFFRRREGPRVVIKWDPISSLEDPRQQCQRETKRPRRAAPRGCRGPWSLWLRGTKGRNYLFSQVPHRIQLKRERERVREAHFRSLEILSAARSASILLYLPTRFGMELDLRKTSVEKKPSAEFLPFFVPSPPSSSIGD